MTGAPWRLVVDGRGDGAFNMAVDEAILEGYDGDQSGRPPTLRLYGWAPAALSLGRSQREGAAHDPVALRRLAIDLVRRPTGGTAVLHEHERTYAVVGRLDAPPFTGGVVATYALIAQAVAAGLARLGVDARAVGPGAPARPGPVCFEWTGVGEIASGGRKLVGAAQLRRRRAFLQHGSIPIRLDPSRLAEAVGARVDASRFTDLARALGGPVDDASIDAALAAGFEGALGVGVAPGPLTEREAMRGAELRCWKYDSIAWTRDGVIGEREARWGPVAPR